MHNKKVLIDALRKLGNAKAPTAKKDIIVDPNGQWAHPGEITRIPSNTITMQGVPYPVMAKPNVGQPRMMYPGQDYHFPDADYVDEFPTNNKSLVKKSMGGLTRFSGSAGKMMGLPPIMSTLGNTAPKVVAKFPIMTQDTKNLLTNPAIDSYFPIRFGGDPYLPAGLEAYYIDPQDYNILNEATQQLETDPNWRQEGLKNAYSSLYGSGKLDGYDPNLIKGKDYEFKNFSPGWQVSQNALHQLAGPQWMPSKEDFFTDKEIINLFQKEIDYRNARNQFDKMYPEDPATTMWNAFNQDTSRDELFSNLFPGVYMPNFRSKILSPEQTEALINKGLYNPTFTNKKMLNKSSLSSLTKGEDTLPRTYKEYIDTYDINSPLYTGDPKLIASEFRGQLGLKLDDINNATPEQLEAWRKQVIIKLRNSALERWQKETSNKLSGSDAYNQLMNRSGARNKDGGVVKKEGGESPKEFVSAKEGVDTPIYKQVSVKPSKIQGKGLFTNEPIRAGEPIGISHIRKVFNRNGELYQAPFPSTVLGYYNHSEEPNVREVDNGDHIVMVATRDIKPNEELTSNYNLSGIPDLEKPEDFKKGGSIPKLPKKKNARAYSRSLEATNRLLAEHPFFAQPKSRKNKIYDPNSQYFQDGGESGDKFKKRLMKRYPGMQGVYGAEGENLSIVKDPNYDARSVGYGDIEFQFPEGNPEIRYDNLIEENGPEYIYPNPSPNTYLALYNPRGANRGDVFLDMMHGMRDDPNYQPLLQNFEKAVRDARGEDMTWEYEGQVKNGSTQSRDRFDENYIDGQLRAQLAPGSIGMFSKGRKDYRIERKYDSPEMRAAAKDIRNYLKGKPTEEDYIEADLTPEEIQEYAKGGYIIEDISVPELTKASYGMITKAGNALSKVSKVPSPSGWVRGTTSIIPRVPPTKLTLGSIPADFPANVTFPLDIYNKDQSGYLTLYPNPKVKGVDDNTFHFLAKMPNSIEAGRAFQLMNQAFTKPNPSILEPYSLSLDSYNMLLNMGKRPDWQMTYENHIPLNYMSVNHNLFEGLEVPRGIRTGRSLKQETADEMVKRLNDMLLQKGMTEQARVFNVPGSSLKEIQVPNYRLTRQYANGGFLPKAANGLPVGLSELGKLGRAGLYKSINPAGYAILDKVKALPTELYKNTVSNETRPFRVGMSLKYGHQPHLETLLKIKRIPLEEFKKMSDKDRMQVFDQSTLSKLNDIGQRRLDAWAVGLGLPQEYGTLEQIGDNKFRMLNTAYSPDYFNDLYNDLRASGYEQGLSFGHNPLEDLTREHYRIKRQANYGNEQELDDWMRQQDAMRIAGWNPWVRSRHAKLNDLQPFSGVSTGKVWDNDQFGVMGGFGWDINDHPQGLQFTTNDIWDLNPWEKRGHAYLNPTDAAKQIAASSFFKPLQNVEALKLVGGKPFLIENNFVVDPKTYKTLDSWEEGGNVDYTLGDEVDEATMRELEKLGYTFEKI